MCELKDTGSMAEDRIKGYPAQPSDQYQGGYAKGLNETTKYYPTIAQTLEERIHKTSQELELLHKTRQLITPEIENALTVIGLLDQLGIRRR